MLLVLLVLVLVSPALLHLRFSRRDKHLSLEVLCISDTVELVVLEQHAVALRNYRAEEEPIRVSNSNQCIESQLVRPSDKAENV